MSYEARISRSNPACVIVLVDESAGAASVVPGGSEPSWAQVVADHVNAILEELVVRSSREDGIRDYFSVAVLGYAAGEVESAFGGALLGRTMIPISAIAAEPVRIEKRARQVADGAGGHVATQIHAPVWVEPAAKGGRPMCQALEKACELARAWVDLHRGGYPPIVLNVACGEATDGNPIRLARQLRAISSDGDPTLLFNLYVSNTSVGPISFPSDGRILPDECARRLFSMSSILPRWMRLQASYIDSDVSERSRGFLWNTSIASFTELLDIGAHPAFPEL